MRNDLLKECSHIEEYSTYNAEAHHQIAASQWWVGKTLEIGPAVITAILGALTASGYLPGVGAWLTAAAAIFTAFSTALDPLATSETHLRAGKAWTTLKQDARRLRDTFSPGLSDDALTSSVQALADRYNDLVAQTPATSDAAFAKAREKIQKELHKPDNPVLKPRI